MINFFKETLNKNKIFYKIWEVFKNKLLKTNFNLHSKKAIKRIKVNYPADPPLLKWAIPNYPQLDNFYKKIKDNYY